MIQFTHKKSHAFTLIELLTVIAVIAILAGILTPVASGVIRQSRIASSKARLWQYITALESFKAEYNYYPQVYTQDANNNGLIDLSTNSANFIKVLSGVDAAGGNFRKIRFYSFSENEFENQDSTTDQLSDQFNNTAIFIMVDLDGDGIINPDSDDPESPGEISGTATAWVEAAGNSPGYALWD